MTSTFTRVIPRLAVVLMAGALVTNARVAPLAAQAKADQKAKQDQKQDDDAVDKAIEAKACPAVDVKFDAQTDKTQHPVPAPSDGKAMVFVVRPTMMGNKVQSKLAVDGQWVGGNRGDNYFYFPLAPGEHFVCSQAENRSVLAVTVEAGKTYFLQQKISMGFMKASNKVVMLDEAEGRKGLEKTNLSIFTPKEK